jgi:site-specific DNA-methyltransferase (adenine-specific)
MPISIAENKDCMIAMAEFEDKYFDLAIVDPPYGIGASNMTMGKGSRNDSGKNKLKTWDDNKPTQDYFNELFRVSTYIIIWGGNYYNLGPARCYLLWDKLDYNSDFASHELAWTNYNRVVKCFRQARNIGEEIKIHPTQKPVRLYEWILKNYAQSGWRIIDTHLGSGSSRIAAYNLGFDFWGYEIDEDYFNDQEKRFNGGEKLFQL